MGFFKFLTITLLVTIFSLSVKSDEDCSFDISSFEGSQERFNIILKNKEAAESHFKLLKDCSKKSINHILDIDYSKDFEENTIRDFSVEDAFYGYTAYFDPEFVKTHLENNADIEIVEKDGLASIDQQCHDNCCLDTRKHPTRNLDRIDQKKFPLDGKYTYPTTAGEGVTIYIVDSGILFEHNEFEGRAVHGGSFCSGCSEDIDDDGHGTHVAGLAAGKTFGVANKAKLISVKVLDFRGRLIKWSDLISGLSFVLKDHKSKPNQNSVVNMSLSGPKSKIVNTAVKALTDNNIHVVVTAGNHESDACERTPASEETAITVGATEEKSNRLTDFSGFGKCVDIFAPGENILSAYNDSKNSTRRLFGTSMSAPQVSGTVALIISEYGNSSPSEMVNTLKNFATKDIIPNTKGSPNIFLRVPPCKQK